MCGRSAQTAAKSICSSLLLVLIASGCSSPNIEDRLRPCPTDDLVWEAAVEEARSEGSLTQLREFAVELSETNPDRWEPPWIAGESLYQEDRRAPVETFERMKVFWVEALRRAESSNDPVGISRAANRLGTFHMRVADLASAEQAIQRALEAAELANRDDLRALAWNNLAGVYRSQVRLAEAIHALERAIFYIERTGKTAQARGFAYNRSLLLGDVGQLSERRKVLERIYEESQQAGEMDRLHRICVAMGNHHLLLNELDAGREWFMKVPAASAQAPRAALGLGRISLRELKYAEAVKEFDRAIAADLPQSFSLFAETFRAEVDLRTGKAEAARVRLAAAIADADESGIREIAAMARSLYGKALLEEVSRIDEAIEYFREAVEIVEGAGEGLNPTHAGMTYLRERSEPFAELAAALALRHGSERGPEILRIMERAHARALRQILGEAGGSAAIVELGELQENLRSGELVIDYLIGQDRGTILAVGPNEIVVQVLPGWNQLRHPLRRYISALKRPLHSADARIDPERDLARDLELGRELRRLLLGPASKLLAATERLFLVPDRDLALLPFAALPLDDSHNLRFLGEEIEIAVMPMAGLTGSWSDLHSPLLLAGDPLPDPDGQFGPLPLASAEIAGVRDVWSAEPHTELARADLALERLLELRLESYKILHFATHAVASSRDPDRCAVILSGGDRLDMRRITGLTLGPALVVLSACQTGEGEVVPGEGVVGLTWAFLSAGAHGVVASLWSVEDSATTELMVAFHRELKAGSDPVRALSLAQRQILETRRHPLYWAPFVVILSPQPDAGLEPAD